MPRRNRTIIRQEQAFAAGDARILQNLPVNPLSFVDIVLRGQATTAAEAPTLTNILTTLTRIEVLFKGSSFISLDPRDLYALMHAMGWAKNIPHPVTKAVADRFRMMLRLSFSRVPWWANEGFPASRAGELEIGFTPAATFTNVGTMSLHVEPEELLEATFARYLKYTTLSRTPTATGESDVDLPIGNPLAAILLFGTTSPSLGSDNASMREVRVLVDNQEAYVPRSRWDALHGEFQRAAGPGPIIEDHIHNENIAAAYTQNADTEKMQTGSTVGGKYGWLEFDPLRDGSYFLETAGRSSVKLRINADVADAQRIVPVELISVAGAAGAAA